MKISGTGGAPPPTEELSSDQPARPGGAAAFAAHLEQTADVGAASAAEAPRAPAADPAGTAAAADPARGVAADLRAGRITPAQAVDRLLENTVTRQIGAQAPEAARERLRAALVELLAKDPHLAELIKRLERTR